VVTESFKILQSESSLSSLSSLYSSYITALLPLNILGIPSAGNERRTVREQRMATEPRSYWPALIDNGMTKCTSGRDRAIVYICKDIITQRIYYIKYIYCIYRG
jgi:hypothetical protein